MKKTIKALKEEARRDVNRRWFEEIYSKEKWYKKIFITKKLIYKDTREERIYGVGFTEGYFRGIKLINDYLGGLVDDLPGIEFEEEE